MNLGPELVSVKRKGRVVYGADAMVGGDDVDRRCADRIRHTPCPGMRLVVAGRAVRAGGRESACASAGNAMTGFWPRAMNPRLYGMYPA